MLSVNPDELGRAITRLDKWLEGMRSPQGYGGPVSHWWDSSLIFSGAMLDWRYEGIVCGYLNLHATTGESRWLDKARRACNDLAAGQQPDGSFKNSAFEHGPSTGGTPHEAAACIALLETASILRNLNDAEWNSLMACAGRYLEASLARLWGGRGFNDQPQIPVLVANKNATMLEALLLYQDLSGIDMGRYIDACRQVVLSAQVKDGPDAGATIHRGTYNHQVSFGIYTARCVGAFARLQSICPNPQNLEFLSLAAAYLQQLILPNGTLLGYYRRGRAIRSPYWISPSGELLRALLQARQWVDVSGEIIVRMTDLLIRQQTATGGIPTAYGLAQRGSLRSPQGTPDFRDVLPVTGWCDKAFRALTMLGTPRPADISASETSCQWRGIKTIFREDVHEFALLQQENKRIIYLWKKGSDYPDRLELW